MIDIERQRRRRRHNAWQAILLLAGMIALLAACGWSFAGLGGLLWLGACGGLALYISVHGSPRLVLRLFQAKPLSRRELAEVHAIVQELSARAELPKAPSLYFVSSPVINAIAVGDRNEASLALTGGLLRTLNLRELAGVLAHEIAHIAHNDIRVMALADVVSRLTRVMSYVGLMLLLINLPLLLSDGEGIPWLLVILLIAAPVVGTLLQLALSRTREFDADLEAVRLTGDPMGLVAALQKMERHTGRIWEEIFLPGRRTPDPSVLRTHPLTEDRVARLRALEIPSGPTLSLPDNGSAHHGSVQEVPRRARHRWSGFWF
jgi:heat shock protein HtpX